MKTNSASPTCALIASVEARVRNEMMNAAVTQTIDGRIQVDPNKVYVGREEGQRALDQLRSLMRAR